MAYQIRRACILDHVERILVTHVDDGRADLDAARPRADRGEQREWGCELLRKVVHAKVRAIRAEILGGDGQLDRLLENVLRRSRPRLARCVPMTKGEEADF